VHVSLLHDSHRGINGRNYAAANDMFTLSCCINGRNYIMMVLVCKSLSFTRQSQRYLSSLRVNISFYISILIEKKTHTVTIKESMDISAQI